MILDLCPSLDIIYLSVQKPNQSLYNDSISGQSSSSIAWVNWYIHDLVEPGGTLGYDLSNGIFWKTGETDLVRVWWAYELGDRFGKGLVGIWAKFKFLNNNVGQECQSNNDLLAEVYIYIILKLNFEMRSAIPYCFFILIVNRNKTVEFREIL